ncbi:unnamed protein product [Linum trigynum]|uniref:Uncharacterized protein n=1 Tax=Linum trigynum TaxID=586398 RepID=A0AAV2GMC1_9ROSI
MTVVSVPWRIWRSRNLVVFEGKQYGFPALMRQFSQQYEEWVGLPMDASPPPQHSLQVVQQPGMLDPTAGVACQWDGATRKGSHSVGGLVLPTPIGGVLMARGVQFHGIDAHLW